MTFQPAEYKQILQLVYSQVNSPTEDKMFQTKNYFGNMLFIILE